jgi:Family of unknown function (DUF6505)
MRMLRTIRMDATDTLVFARAAEPGEWAVPGAFEYAMAAKASLLGKERQAFRAGFLGLTSFARSTFAVVATVEPAELAAATDALARHFLEKYGAPTQALALAAAQEEIAFSQSLCDEHAVNTVLALDRDWNDEGDIRERFRPIRSQGETAHARIWDVVAEVESELDPPGTKGRE